jgi:hypothetical protein
MGTMPEPGPDQWKSASGKRPKSRQQALRALLKQARKEARKVRKAREPRKDYHDQDGLLAEQFRSALEEERQRREARRRQGW